MFQYLHHKDYEKIKSYSFLILLKKIITTERNEKAVVPKSYSEICQLGVQNIYYSKHLCIEIIQVDSIYIIFK